MNVKSEQSLFQICAVWFFSPDILTDPSTLTDQLSIPPAPSSPGKLSVASNSPELEKEKRQRNNNGEMPEWMVNFVTTNNLIVGKDVKLDESKASQKKKRSSHATSGKGNGARVGTKTGSKAGVGSQTSRPKSRSSPGGPKKSGISPTGPRRPSVGRPITPAK